MVDNVAATVEAVLAHGGEIVPPIGEDAPEVTARFRDPGGTSSACISNAASGEPHPEADAGYRSSRDRSQSISQA